MIDALNAVSVDEMHVTECVLLPDDAKNSMSVVSASDYVISFEEKCSTEEKSKLLGSVMDFMVQKEIVILKKTKKSEREENIKPGIMKCELRGDSMYMQFHYHIHRLETYMDSPKGGIMPLYQAGTSF